MAECPFCGGEVEEDLITFGGPCPKCFAHIPGEEAATDPGEEVRAAQEAQDRRRSALRAMIPIALAVPVVMCLGVGALYFVLRPDPEVAVLDFDEFDDYPMPEIVAAAPPDGAKEGEPKSSGGTKVASQPRPSKPDASKFAPGGDIGSGGASAADLGGDGVASVDDGLRRREGVEGPAAGPASLSTGDMGATGSQQSGLNFGLDVTTNRRSAVLEDPEEIKRMIGTKMQALIPTLNQCYERQLKVDENLQGKWRIKYVVSADGTVADPSAVALQSGNADFESCMAAQMVRWRFERIKQDQPVQKTLSFRPAG